MKVSYETWGGAVGQAGCTAPPGAAHCHHLWPKAHSALTFALCSLQLHPLQNPPSHAVIHTVPFPALQKHLAAILKACHIPGAELVQNRWDLGYILRQVAPLLPFYLKYTTTAVKTLNHMMQQFPSIIILIFQTMVGQHHPSNVQQNREIMKSSGLLPPEYKGISVLTQGFKTIICTSTVNKAVSLTDVPLHQNREPSVTLTQFYSKPHFSPHFQEKARFHAPIRTSGDLPLICLMFVWHLDIVKLPTPGDPINNGRLSSKHPSLIKKKNKKINNNKKKHL